ncbi:MAG TPA: hypothetical protein VFV34_23630 [Blastocatellia bacterium]|nr:hypothetical protein [Blastocatellia bacterium]
MSASDNNNGKVIAVRGLAEIATLFVISIASVSAPEFGLSTKQSAPQNPAPNAPPKAGPAVDEWSDDFDGAQLDSTKWESYTFEGGSGGKIEVKDRQLRLRGMGESRSGVRTKTSFRGDRFYVEATLAKVGPRAPQPGENAFPPGYAILTVLFDGNSVTRLEWILRSDGIFEAWHSFEGKLERLDNGKLATKEKNPRLGIGRRGDQVFFMLNREVGLERTLRGLPASFKVMLYGYGSSENNWDSVYVQTLKQ